MRTHLLMMGKGKSVEELKELAKEWESVNHGDVDNAECYSIQNSRMMENNGNNSKTELLERRLIDCERRSSMVIFLGYRISAEGIGTDIEKISAMGRVKPTTVKDLRIFLGFCTYYSKFVMDYTTMTELLNKLLGR